MELDERTANALEARAEDRGVSVSELIAEFALQSAPARIPQEEIDSLDREWIAIKAGEPTVSHDQVVRWLETWGTPAFKSWRAP